MEFIIKSGSPEKQRSACVIVGVYEIRKLSFAGELLDRVSGGVISDVLRRGDINGKLGSHLMLHRVPNTLCDRILLVGLGKERDFNIESFREANRVAMRALLATSSAEAANYLVELPCKKQSVERMVEQAVLVASDMTYRFERFKRDDKQEGCLLTKMVLAVPRRTDLAEGEKGMERGLALAHGVELAKDLGNMPPNLCTPTYLAEKAVEVAKAVGATVEVLDEEAIAKEGMNTFLAVARGSRQTPKFIVLKHNAANERKAKPIVLVGKGITFDSGGISLKPAASMDEMKYDMCGAASVLGAFQAAVESKLPLNLVALIPTCENMPDGNASRPGDIIKTMAGLTVEILNTDAEGRLILCDALCYAERFSPQIVVDVATLTGACVIALGHVASGVFSSQDGLARELVSAGEEIGDKAWHMPLWDEYYEQLKSPFADLANVGGREAGSITAACFLSRFAEEYDWAHLDIAGTAWRSGKEKGATGRPVPLLVQFLRDRADIAEGLVPRRGRPRRESHDEDAQAADDDEAN